jgi:acetoin:2,6-dichlorophenolindophenol oxidoreductase subunit alpha
LKVLVASGTLGSLSADDCAMTVRAVGPRLLATMWLIRAFEEQVSELVRTQEVVGLVHLGIGQEAVAAGVCAHLRPDDYLYSSHRAHGHFLAKGASPERLMAELMGRRDGLCAGKGGSMHLVQADRGLLGATGIVGGSVPLALGSALVAQDRGQAQVTVVFFGDGAAQAGHFLESLNLASLWELPVLLVCENNGYAEFTPRSAHSRVAHVSQLAEPYGISSTIVDGNDALAVWAAAGSLVDQLRSGRGPALLECLTFRLRGHYEGDPAAYRRATDVAEWKEKDPIERLVRQGTAAGWLDEAQLAATVQEARAAVQRAVEFGRSSPFPGAEELLQHVYA